MGLWARSARDGGDIRKIVITDLLSFLAFFLFCSFRPCYPFINHIYLSYPCYPIMSYPTLPYPIYKNSVAKHLLREIGVPSSLRTNAGRAVDHWSQAAPEFRITQYEPLWVKTISHQQKIHHRGNSNDLPYMVNYHAYTFWPCFPEMIDGKTHGKPLKIAGNRVFQRRFSHQPVVGIALWNPSIPGEQLTFGKLDAKTVHNTN